jgi:hypothetical protein
MTFAEVLTLVAGGVLIYVLLRPIQRRLEHWLLRRIATRHQHDRGTVIDVTDFKSHISEKEDHEHRF